MARPLRVDGARLNAALHQTCDTWGALAVPSTGMRRLALGREDKAVRDWLVAECKSLGCAVRVDQMGNVFAVRPGSAAAAAEKPIAMGSHLDTQPSGGRYDGILGVHAALEVLRTLHDNGVRTHCPLAVVDWTNEEGARFPGAMMASGVWSGQSSAALDECHAVTDSDGVSVRAALREIGYLGDTPCDCRQNALRAHFELHIEQGPLLERAGRSVGVVTAVQGMKWFRVRVGTTPMADRSDALVTASRLIASSDTSSQATIPPGVEFIIDVRCSTDQMVDDLSADIFKRFDKIVSEEANSTAYLVQRTWGLPESKFHPDCIAAVREAAVEEVGEEQVMEMKSKAGHDSAWTSRVVPTTMIFVPSRDGISHNPNEYTSPEHCSLGAQVLLDAVLAYDKLVANADR
ncbi:putative n-carbamoyl-l-amino acid hydrolase protein [Neofusicoccum parvum UCRNP2]|uniref:Putative n-carbamoyl-l-amino acid hydrolase protein n=1 Tax=Botryosphaeria parva (strain UCR-NP2) TaxID=1287680 RepID=R1GAN5_BOTPV|nr:putative n-carbamoyl-l-amino acid hydrolase protein [Neofusicoccum parvum UCRNP2]